jgi:hypothetical protein
MHGIRKVQILFGTALFIAFLLTGQYLQRVFVPVHQADLALRMMARANHLAILFLSLLNVTGALVEFGSGSRRIRLLGSASRMFVMLSGLVFVAVFATQPEELAFPREYVLMGVVLALAGSALGAVLVLWGNAKKPVPGIRGPED